MSMMKPVQVFFLPTPFTGVAHYIECITSITSNQSL